ncbi:uncharacterized protein Z520_02825 [Fonsecaea multimorphosa CBS 102226]|uniref:Uncharacterized protein n=1 Tax=Fonsecaea multimorphosa CBS 102226 TaxID=1442371 RepID=A0A0D2K629_9EURO|nr:uncharacterized protein Z520_02825 [Fonsecaea multimorphosa CBS 102226]KIY01273.1 hypothetical protein Z520_02825 [Fonsecaea multimorphosa CBS 102226]
MGDSWEKAKRYNSTKLHTIRGFAHLPFARTVDPSYNEWMTKDELAEGYARWAKK